MAIQPISAVGAAAGGSDFGYTLPGDDTFYTGQIYPEDPSAPASPTAPDGQNLGFYDFLKSIFGFTEGTETSELTSYNTAELMKQYMEFIRDNTDYNNAWSAEQAQKQMDFQTLSQKLAQEFNAKEAAKNRKWQQYMSNTAHQREVADLKAAGLNPILSATGGNGAAVTSGATASGSVPTSGAKGDSDQSANSAITGLFGSMFSAITNIASSALNAQTQVGVAEKYTQMYELIEKMQEAYKEHEHEKYPDTMWETIASLITATIGGIDTLGGNITGMFDKLLDKFTYDGKIPTDAEEYKDWFTKKVTGVDSIGDALKAFLDKIKTGFSGHSGKF